MQVLDSRVLSMRRGEAALSLARRAILPARRMLPEFADNCSPDAVRRLAYMLYSTLGEPSYFMPGSADGPVRFWVVSLRNANGIVSFELWLNADIPRYYIFVDRASPPVDRLLSRLARYLYSPLLVVRK